MPFSDLGLSPALLSALAVQGFAQPTSVQTQAIHPIVTGRDILATAQTGAGKTIAYCAPLIQRVQAMRAAKQQARALILVPTRELAVQVGEVLHALSHACAQRMKVSVVFGGVSINPQMMALRGGTDLIVATPGRLLDLLEHNALSLSAVQMLVLDEADRMLDLGFSEELARVLALLPVQRQSLFFSATFPPAAQVLAQTLLKDPVRIDVRDAAQDRPAITHRAIAVDAPRRTQLLRHLIHAEDWTRVLVFVATKHAAEIVADKLRKAGLQAEPFHGVLSQGKRTQVLADRQVAQSWPSGGALPWRAKPRQTYTSSRRFQGIAPDRGGRYRHGGPGLGHFAVACCGELRPAPFGGGLHPPHRPSRTCGRARAGHQHGERKYGSAFPVDRKAPRHRHGARAHCRVCPD